MFTGLIGIFIVMCSVYSGQIFANCKVCECHVVHSNIDYDSLNCEGDKVYLSSDRLMISETSLCVLVPTLDGLEIAIPVTQLNVDDAGIFIFAEQIGKIIGRCRNGHSVWHTACGGCGVMWCPARCRCFG